MDNLLHNGLSFGLAEARSVARPAPSNKLVKWMHALRSRAEVKYLYRAVDPSRLLWIFYALTGDAQSMVFVSVKQPNLEPRVITIGQKCGLSKAIDE